MTQAGSLRLHWAAVLGEQVLAAATSLSPCLFSTPALLSVYSVFPWDNILKMGIMARDSLCQTHFVDGELVSLRQGGRIFVFGNEYGYSVLKEHRLLAEVISWWLRKPVLGAHRPGCELQSGCWPAAGPWVNSCVLVCWVGQLL